MFKRIITLSVWNVWTAQSKMKLSCFSIIDEDLIKHILADGQNFFPQADESEMADL